MPIPKNPVWSSIEEAATVLNVSRNTVYALVKSGAIPGRRFGRSWRIPISAIHPDKLSVSQ